MPQNQKRKLKMPSFSFPQSMEKNVSSGDRLKIAKKIDLKAIRVSIEQRGILSEKLPTLSMSVNTKLKENKRIAIERNIKTPRFPIKKSRKKRNAI